MAALRLKPTAQDVVEARLADGSYDRLLADFQVKIDEATDALRRMHEAMRAENTLRS